MIDKIIKQIKKRENFIRYCTIGVSGATLDFIIFYFLTEKLNLFYQYANIISVSAGIINNFFLNAFLNFKIKDKLFIRFLIFYSVGTLGIGISASALYVFISLLNLNVLFSKLIVIIIVVIVQYTLNKTISFRKSKLCPQKKLP